MTNSPEEKLKSLLKYKIDVDNFEYRQWFLKQFESDVENSCSLEEFAVYFLNTLRQYAEVHLKSNDTETPKCQTPVKTLKSNRDDINIEQTTNNSCIEFELNTSTSTPTHNTSIDRLGISLSSTSTPARRNTSKISRKLSTTPTSTNKSATSSLCLGDFILLNTPTSSRSHKKKITPTTSQQSSQKTQNEKPKKRVQPISISKKVEKSDTNLSIFGGESSFSKENNILKISNNELEDKDQCAILAARRSLAMNTCDISKEIRDVSLPLASAVADIITTSTPVKEPTTEEMSLDLKSLQNNDTLKRLAHIYALIVDLNLVTNILNELSFLLNLINVSYTKNINEERDHLYKEENYLKGFSMLEDASNAIYFAILCLEHEKLSLASLDAKSLGVVLLNDRFCFLNNDVKTYLTEIYQLKQIISAENPFSDTYLCHDSKAYNNVYFQHEHDSKENFTSYQEFTNFRAQRDLFYKCLKIWESKHLNPNWKFSLEISPKIKEIFHISENCINMAHLAKLFVSQLVLSTSNASSPEDIGLDVDLLKFSKLTQRLIAPSQFSVDYQFPRTEAFFRDFILVARSFAFVEQLKMELYSQLVIQNDSSLDHINISKTENDADDQNISLIDDLPSFIVRPTILSSLLILAKFLGFTVSLPYNFSGCILTSARIEKNQIRLRSLMQNTFDVHLLFEQAVEQRKLLITIPWLVQYFAMLDNITLQLENYKKTLKLMFALYSYMGSESPKHFCVASMFTIKLCLGWLFESKQFIAEQYYNYRAELNGDNTQESTKEFEFIKRRLHFDLTRDFNSDSIELNPHLESLLPIACPFLAEFRVSIMPAKYAQTKNASRTGRYRHVTTRLAELPSSATANTVVNLLDGNRKKDTVQSSLIQAFFHSQNSSTRQIIKFCTERCYKSTVKDGQLKILLPAKTNADNLVNQITSSQYHFVYNSIKSVYGDAYAQVKEEWKNNIPKILHKRIDSALESLLSEETSSVLKRTYLIIIKKEASIKINQWFYANIIVDNYFCSNLQEMANKICSANKNKVDVGSNLLTIMNDNPSVSELIDEFQYWLHCTSIRLDRFNDPKPLVELLKNLIKSFDNELPFFLYKILGAGIIQLLQNIISKKCANLSNELIEIACQVWLHPNMLKALNSFSSNGICIYDDLVNKMFIESIGRRTECFHHLKLLIIMIIKKQVITVAYVNELFVSLFKHEWHPFVFTEISNMLESIAKETAEVSLKCNGNANEEYDEDDIEKSNLFMEMLADMSRDIDHL